MSNEKRNLKVCHMTDAHIQEDIRIFHKECISLAGHGFDTYQVSRGKEYEKNGVHMVGIGEISGNRLLRMTRAAKRVYQAARNLDADIYHIHDPELLPYGMKLKRQGKKVIFDSHEDVPAQIMDKAWIPVFLRRAVSVLYRLYETHAAKRLDAVIAATPYIAEQFQKRAKRVAVVNNYPKLEDIQFHDTPFKQRDSIVCYAGGINENRGEKVMIEAMKDVDGVLILAGEHEEKVIEEGSVTIRYTGRLDREGINDLYGRAVLGLCMLMPTGNYINCKPIKMYEYMAAGLPFICSSFRDCIEVAEETKAGICIAPDDINALHKAIESILNDRENAEAMGKRGRAAVEKYYNWGLEEGKLIELYQEM